jgi:hypothetical protein
MSIILGNTTAGALYLGSTKIGTAYLGSTQILKSAPSSPYYWLSYLDQRDANENFKTDVNEINYTLYGYCSTASRLEYMTYGTIASSDIDGMMPASYVGQHYITNPTNYAMETKSRSCIPADVKEWTVGYWWKPTGTQTSETASTILKSNLMNPGNVANGNSAFGTVSRIAYSVGDLMSIKSVSDSYTAGTDTTYTSGSSWRCYKITNLTNGWRYVHVYYNSETSTMEWYINGVKRLTCKLYSPHWGLTPDSTYGESFLVRWSCLRFGMAGPNGAPSSPGAGRKLCELVVYKGKVLTIPTAPLINNL